MGLGFRAKLLGGFLGLVVVVELVTALLLNRTLGDDLVRKLDLRLEQQARSAARWLGAGRHPARLAPRLSALLDARVTIYDEDGIIVGDSGEAGLRGRRDPDGATPEVAEAVAGRIGRSNRYAAMFSTEMRYVAVRIDGRAGDEGDGEPSMAGGGSPRPLGPDGAGADGGGLGPHRARVVRLGVPLDAVRSTIQAMRYRLGVALLLAFVVALGLSLLTARRIARPLRAMTAAAERMATGDYDVAVPTHTPDEFGALGSSLTALGSQLKADIERMRRLERVRRDFVANASHALRTPVTSIGGYAETLLRTPTDTATAREFLTTIHRHAGRMSRLVDRLLRLSTLEAGTVEPSGRPTVNTVDVDAVVAEVLRTVGERASAAGITLVGEVAPSTLVRGDAEALEEILENLVDNAVKYGRQGGSVVVRGRRAEQTVVIEVADDGPGIPAEHLPHVFERFYRAEADASRDGSGLGLAIVRQLVESLGGRVEVESTPAVGARFRVHLPAVPRRNGDS
jgi:signal transduction histidine kinase